MKYLVILILLLTGCDNGGNFDRRMLSDLIQGLQNGKTYTFRSHNGQMQGSDHDLDIVMENGGKCTLTFYMDTIETHNGEYSINEDMVVFEYKDKKFAMTVGTTNNELHLVYLSGTPNINAYGEFSLVP